MDRWDLKIWKTDSRIYIGEVKQNLFGEWVLRLAWSGLHNRQGNIKTGEANSYDHAVVLLKKVEQRRKTRGYSLVV